MKKLFAIALLLASAPHAQVITGEAAVSVSNLTVGYETSIFNDASESGIPYAGNLVYADRLGGFDTGTIPNDFVNALLVRTLYADRDTTTGTIVSFTLNRESLVCVWHATGIASKPAWIASNGYVSYNKFVSSTSGILFGNWEAFCGLQSGALTFSGNTTDGTTTNPHYFITIQAPTFQAGIAPTVGGAGEYSFVSTAETIAESTTTDIGCVTRTNGSSGAVSVDITEGVGSTCAGPDTTFTDPFTINWADAIEGQGGCLSLTANAVSGDCTVDLEFTNAVGGISAGSSNQTSTITVEDTPAAGSDYWVGKDGSDGNSCATAQTEGTPKLTINAGIACLSAGETLTVKAGTYTETNMIGNNIPNGTSWGNVTTVKAKSGDTVTINMPSGTNQYRSLFLGGSPGTGIVKQYIEINGFIFDETKVQTWHDGALIDGATHHIRITGNTFKNATAQGLTVNNADSYYPSVSVGGHEILNNVFDNNGQSPYDHGMYFKHANSKIWNNTFSNNSGFGLHLYDGDARKGPDNSDVQYNIAYGNVLGGLLSNGNNNLIANNITYSTGDGITLFNSGDANKVYNNTIAKYTGSIGLKIWSGSTGNFLTNNILWGTGTDISEPGGGNTKLTNLFTDPSFTDESANDFTIGSGSAACEAGTTVAEVTDDYIGTARPQDSSYEIGAYETAACP